MQVLSMFRSPCARRFLPKIIIIRIERGETIKDRRERGERLFGLWSLVREVRSVRDCERGRNGEWLNGEKRVWRCRGSKEGEAGRRVQEVQTQTPRSGFTNPRRKVREEPNAGVRSQIPRLDFVVYRGPEKVQVSRDVDRLVTIKARVKEKFFSFSEASASFQAERFFFDRVELLVCW
jgi:hypothetical protein